MTGRVIAGLGCRRGCSAEDIVNLFHHACNQIGRRADALACPVFKSTESGLREAARQLGLPLILVDATALSAAQARCATHSPRAEQAVGVSSVAEGCAIAAAGAGAHLLLARIANGAATCALAEQPPA